jgi:hypothetical protein
MSLIQSGAVGEEVSKTRGLIKKESVDGSKFECFNYNPMAIKFKVASVTSATVYVMESVDGLSLKLGVINTKNQTGGRIGAIDTSTKTITLTSVGGTTFSAVAGDYFLAIAPVYADNSSSPYILMKDEDNLYNITQINRFPSAISASKKGDSHYGKDYWARVRKQVVMEGLRKVEGSAIWSERASGTNLTTTDGTLSDLFRTTRGTWNWAVGGGAHFDAGGSMTHEKFVRNLALAMNDTVGSQNKLIMYCNRSQFADMCMWANEKLMVTEQGTLKKFGVTSKVFVTSGPEIEAIVHDSFNQFDGLAQIFDPEMVSYKFKKDRDFHPVLGIQNNDVDGVEDDFLGEWGMGVDDGGSSMTYITNW